MEILAIEDNAEIQILIEAALDQHHVVRALNLAEAKAHLEKTKLDLILLDVELPDGDGLRFLTQFAANGAPRVPIFILTAQADTANKVIAFSLGADDFVSKPFDPIELRARVDARLRKMRTQTDNQAILKLRDVRIDVPRQRVFIVHDGQEDPISLTSLEFRLLLVFAGARERVFSREELLDRVWGNEVSVTDRTVDTHVGHLRKKMQKSTLKIETVVNEGYRLI